MSRLLRLAGPRAPVPAESAARVRTIAAAEWRRVVRRRAQLRLGGWMVAGLGVAAALLIAFVLRGGAPVASRGAPVVAELERTEGPVRLSPRARPDEAPGSPAHGALTAGTWIETGSSGRAAVRLRAGPSLRLDYSTRARLVAESVVLLDRGAAYVDSGGEREHPALEVRTAVGVAREIGTQFELRLAGTSLRLRVREGTVNLDHAGKTLTAGEGEELRLGTGEGVERGVVALHGPAWEWAQAIAPTFGLEGSSLRAFLAWYSRETRYGIDITRAPSVSKGDGDVLHGSIEGLTPQEALSAVLPACGLKSRLAGAVLVVEPLGDSAPSGLRGATAVEDGPTVPARRKPGASTRQLRP